MDFTLIIQRFAEQGILILFCGIVIYFLYKMLKDEQIINQKERIQHKEDMREQFNTLREINSEDKELLKDIVIVLENLKK